MAKSKRPKRPTTIRFGADGEILNKYALEDYRVNLIIGPLGSGKTTTTIQKLFRYIVMQKPNSAGERKSRWVAIRNTYPDLETTTIPDFREIFTDDYGEFKMSTPPRFLMDFPLEDGTRVISEVLFLALDQEEDVKKLRGTQLTGGWLNETKEIPRAVLDMLDSRIGRYPSRAELGSYFHGIIGDSNAPDEEHWLAEFYYDTPKNWKIWMQPGGVLWRNGRWVLNPAAENKRWLPEGYYENLIQGKKKDWISVNVENKFGAIKDGKPVHPDFSTDIHRSPTPLPYEPSCTLYVGIDFGRTPAAALGQHINGQWRILRELVTEDMGAFKFGGILKRFLNEEFDNASFEAWGDPSGEDMAQTRDETPFEMLAAAGIEAFPAFTNDPDIRFAALDNLLCSISDGQPRILIDPSCKVLLKGLNNGYQFKRLKVSGADRFHDKPSKNKWSHICEALHYMLLGGGEAEFVTGSFDTSAYAEIESEADFDGWHPKFTGLNGYR